MIDTAMCTDVLWQEVQDAQPANGARTLDRSACEKFVEILQKAVVICILTAIPWEDVEIEYLGGTVSWDYERLAFATTISLWRGAIYVSYDYASRAHVDGPATLHLSFRGEGAPQ